MAEPLIDTSEAARRLGTTRRRVVALINHGQLKAERVGRVWMIRPSALKTIAYGRAGRPRRIPAEKWSAIDKALASPGATVAAVAAAHGVAESTVSRRRRARQPVAA